MICREILQMQLSAIQSMYERQLAMQELIGSPSANQSIGAGAGSGGGGGSGSAVAGGSIAGGGSGGGGAGGAGGAAGGSTDRSVTIGGVYLHPPSGAAAASTDGTGGSTTSSAVAGLMSRPSIGVLRALSIGTGGTNSGPSSARGSLTVPSSNVNTPAPSLAGSPRTSITIGGDEKQRRGSMNTRHYESIASNTASPAHQLRIDPVNTSAAPLASIGASPASSPPVSPGPKDPTATTTGAATTTTTTTTATTTAPATNNTQ